MPARDQIRLDDYKKKYKKYTINLRFRAGNLPETLVSGLLGYRVTDNPETRQNPAKPEDIFDNVLMYGHGNI
jgi:hypothetical protein